jgi:DUF971 family protein
MSVHAEIVVALAQCPLERFFSTTLWRLGIAGNCPKPALDSNVRPADLQIIGSELAIKWEDGQESFIGLEALRRACPCAGCMGERDVMGQLHKGPDIQLSPRSFQLTSIARVGGYGITPVWADGHRTGIYSFEYLARLARPQS